MTFYTLQALRFIAAIIVLLFHLTLMSSGYKGVDIFFAISGFVMYYTLFVRKRPDAIHFIVNRLTKIFFLYWVALLFMILVQPGRFGDLSIKNIILFPGHFSIVGVSWSLSFELYFYFVVGTCAYLLPRNYAKVLFVILLIITTITTIVNQYTDALLGTVVNYAIGPNFWEFLLGILSAYIAVTFHKRLAPNISLLGACLSLTLFLGIAITYQTPLMFLVYGPLSFLVILFSTAYEQEKPITKKLSEFFQIMGDASYGIYLFGPIITIIINPADIYSKMLIIVTTVIFSTVFNQLIENKLLAFIRKTLYTVFPKT
ncbi:MAG: acyltransferase [Bacteroidota bacterium]